MSFKEQILELKAKGLKQSEIIKLVDCSPSVVCYHYNPLVKQKALNTKRIREHSKPKVKKESVFKNKELIIPIKTVSWKHSEAICNAKLIEYGYETYFPFNGGGEIDLIAIKDGVIHRVQIKCVSPNNLDFILVVLQRQSQNYKGSRLIPYTNIDWFLIYDGTNIYKINHKKGLYSVNLRYTVPKNNQVEGIMMASDYIF